MNHGTHVSPHPSAAASSAAATRTASRATFPFAGGTLGVTTVDKVAIEERVAALAKRSLKKQAKVAGLKLAVSMIDLTTLEGKDTPGKVQALCAKARRPLASDPGIPPCAAICVYPNMVPTAKAALAGSAVHIASVATAFPSGQSPLDIKLDDVRRAVDFGADEIDMVIDRGAMLAGDYAKVFDEVAATKDACGPAHLKVILETGELGTYDLVRHASEIGIAAGGDFIKTSTGKVQPAATPAVTLVMLETIRDHYLATGKKVGMKPAGGGAHRQAGAPLPGHREGDARRRLAHAGSVPLRRQRSPERRAHAARKRAHRQLRRR